MRIGKTKIEVGTADISSVSVNGIVNPANNMLWLGGGVSAQLRKAGGASIETEALAKAPAEVGRAVVTGAGKLGARWIIHAVITGQDLEVTEPALRKAVRSSLEAADSLTCGSLAIPMLIGDFFAYFEIHVAARIIVEETVKYLVNDNKTIEHVVFVEQKRDIRDIFEGALLEMFTKHG